MPTDLFLLLLAFAVLWIGSGLSVSGVEKLSKRVRIPSFLVSFFALGVLTSVSEISVAYFSIVDNAPGISVGNLIGGSAVLTLFVVPLLAILNNGINFGERKEPINFPLAYLVISLPVLLIIDKALSYFDAFLLIFAYNYLVITISVKNTLLDKIENVLNHGTVNVLKETAKILVGVTFIVISCKYVVDTTVIYAGKLGISPFLVGLVLVSIGTNLPELTILIRSTMAKQKTIALGDYVGSAALNSFVLGFLTLFNKGPIVINGGVKFNLLLLPIGALVFLMMTRNRTLDRREGFLLASLYVLFVFLELTL
jgi:cation:H+ antiporter